MKKTDDAPVDIRTRSFKYACRAIRLYQYLQDQKDRAGWVIGQQYLRSSTSVGANLQEARSAESRADFIHKCGLAQKEARESLYWLQLLCETEIVPKRKLQPMMQETDEILSIITSIIVSSKKSRPSST
jgi:four helix bundle protein